MEIGCVVCITILQQQGDLVIFLIILQKFWTIVIGIDPKTLKVTLDNAAVHLTHKTKNVAVHFDLPIYSLPQYSPSLAPTEWMFGIMKKKISHRKPKTIINFAKNYGENIIYESLISLEQVKGSKIWRYFIYQAREVIYKCKNQLNIERLLNHKDAIMNELTIMKYWKFYWNKEDS